jgi:Fe-S oxidoreductase
MIPTREEFLFLTGPEKAIFYLLMAASVGALAYQVAQRVRLWLKGKPTGEVREGWRYWLPSGSALGRWAANVGAYVLAQKKVRQARKTHGAPMHLAIFYGFSALFLATTLLAINSYSPVKFHQGTYYLAYEITFDLLGLLFVVGVAWAIGRRVSIARAQQGRTWRQAITHTAVDSWALVLLLALGLTGYLLEGARIAVDPKPWDGWSPVGKLASNLLPGLDPLGYKGLWWFHTALVSVLLVTLPRMRLRHFVFAIASTAGKPERPMGHLQAISMEEVEKTEKIGVSEAADYSRWHLMSLDACMECGRCTEVCPAWKAGKVLNPKRIVQDLRDSQESGIGVLEALGEESLLACTTCNACVEACPVLIRHVDLIVDARRNLVAEGRLAGSGAVMLRQVGGTGHAWGAPASEREKWMEGLDVPLCRDGHPFEYLFWVGCAGATDPGAVKTTRAVAQLLRQAGVSFACLGREEACTGDPARRIGDEFLFQDKAMANASVFERYGVRKVVTACPHCFNTLKHEYGEFGASLEVWHHTQLLQSLVASGKLRAALQSGLTYHDPCYLGRVNGEVDAPRAILGPIAEPASSGRKTLCCGAGGGRMWMDESPDQRPAVVRMNELAQTGARTVALGCPFCRIMLETGQTAQTPEMRLADVAELLLEANPKPGP